MYCSSAVPCVVKHVEMFVYYNITVKTLYVVTYGAVVSEKIMKMINYRSECLLTTWFNTFKKTQMLVYD